MNKHDASYRLLFSNPDIVRGLFEGLIQAAWIESLDFSRLQPVPSDYISDKLRERLGDCVWRIPRRDGAAVYVLLMLEHQSRNDYIMALLFRLEHNQGIEDVQNLVQTVYDCTRGPRHREVRRAFVSWTRHVLLPRALPEVALPEVGNLLEIKMMLTEHSRSWTHQWKQEGREEGRKEGEADVLQRQLIHKFGALPEAFAQRLQSASPTQLETWSLNLLDATTLDDVFTK